MNILDHIKKYEGFRARPYRCPAGRLTIGYGFNLETTALPKKAADAWLEDLVLDCIEDLLRIFQDFAGFSTRRKIALIDMRYNLGGSGFRGFKKMIAAIRAGDWQEAQLQALDSKWARDVGQRAIVDADYLGDDDG